MKRILIMVLTAWCTIFFIGWGIAGEIRNTEIPLSVGTDSDVVQEKKIKTYYPDGSLWEEFAEKNGRRDGQYREYNAKGLLKRDVEYVDGEIKEIRNYDEKRQIVIKVLNEKISDDNPNVEKNPLMALHNCVSEEAGIKFACNPNWKLSREGKMLTITVSLIPQVQFVIEEANLNLKFLSDFSRKAIASLGRFKDDFVIDRIENCGRETVNVSGYLKNDSETKVSDFFMLDHNNLHSVQFTVKPKESWTDYEPLIKKVINSLEFTGYKRKIKFNLDATDENCQELVK